MQTVPFLMPDLSLIHIFVVQQVGRLDDYLRDVAQDMKLGLDESVITMAGPVSYTHLGPTAAMLSVAKLNHLEATNGALLNVKFHPSAVKGERGLENLCALTDAFFGLGAQHVQYNVVDSEVLRDAQKHPEKYGDLVVRVAGFSVLFTTLDTVLQNDIIERTQHNCC